MNPTVGNDDDDVVSSILEENGPNDPLLAQLRELGMSDRVARSLLKQHPADTIAQQLAALPFRNAKEPAAILTQALRERWALPRTYADSKRKSESKRILEVEQTRETARSQAKEEARALRAIAIDGHLALLDDEERAALEAEAARRLRDSEEGAFWRNRKIPSSITNAFVRGMIAEELGLPDLDDSRASDSTGADDVELSA